MPGHFYSCAIDQDAPAQVGKDQEMRVFREMNELQEFENSALKRE